MKKPITLLLTLILLGCVVPNNDNSDDPPSVPIGLERPVYYAQCNALWGNTTMTVNTICANGCILTSMAMMMATQDASISPVLLDTFFDNNSFYVGDNILWAAVDSFPTTDFTLIQINLIFDSLATLKSQIDAGYYVLLNVNSGGHWVLVFDYDNNGTEYSDFILHDPGVDGADDRLSASDGPSKMTTYRPN